MFLLFKWRFRFLFAALILGFMGTSLKLEHFSNANYSLIGAIANLAFFVFLQIYGEKHFGKNTKQI
jgi:hypothetical protein